MKDPKFFVILISFFLRSCKTLYSTSTIHSNKIDNNITIDYLARHPEWVPIIAEWSYSAWHKYDPTLTFERSLASIKTRLNTDKIPLTLVAIHDNRPIATANLKMSVPVLNVPKNKVWLGSFYVDFHYRNLGVGSLLLKAIYNEAERLGQKEIYLFSSDAEIFAWYIRHDWQIVNKLPYQNHIVTIMKWTAP